MNYRKNTVRSSYLNMWRIIRTRKLPRPSKSLKQPLPHDWSMHAFGALFEVAKATGGLTDSSANPAFSFKKASDAVENYYLLYYTPSKLTADGQFRTIKVRVKGKNYKVTHRAGYFAD